VTAAWTEAGRGTKPLRSFGTVREEATLDQLDQAFRNPRSPASHVVERIRQWAAHDAADLEPELQRRAMHDLDPSRTHMWSFAHTNLGDRWIPVALPPPLRPRPTFSADFERTYL
jgi:hypothetical protein